jgi:hypothetical protein
MTMTTNFRPAQTGFSRVFLIEGRARLDHQPAFQANMKAGSLSQGFGDTESIEVPSPTEFGKFIELGTIRGATERVEITLTSRYAADLKSELLRMARAGCEADVHINFGACTDPSDYNTSQKKIIIESAVITNYDLEDLGALSSDEGAKVDESVDVSGRLAYEVMPVSYASRGGDVITNEILDATAFDTPSCGDCETESDGCQSFFAISSAAGGSPTTPADVVFTIDGGTTILAHDIDTLGISDDPSGIAGVGMYIVVVSEASGSVHYALKSEFNATGDPEFTEVATGVVAGGEPRAIDSYGSGAFVVGAGGYIYKTDDVTAGLTVLDASAATNSDYNAVHALDSSNALAVGNDGAIAVSTNGSTFGLAASPVGVGVNFNDCQMKSATEWLVGTSTGVLYYTLNAGATWTIKAFPGSGTGSVESIYIANDSIVYLSHTTSGNAGRILRSTNGGYDWLVQPEGSAALSANDRINSVVACSEDPDIVMGVGLADDAADGFIVFGSA